MDSDDPFEYLTCYCPDCGSCGEWGCCPFDCSKCRDSDTWDENRMWDVRKKENEPKKPEGYKHYEDWEEMEDGTESVS